MEKTRTETTIEIISIMAGICGFVILIVFTIRLLTHGYNFTGALDIDASAKSGDFVGGVVGSLWTLTSVLLLFITLKLQRKGLRDTSEALRRQQFENNFYNLMRTQQEIVKDFEFEFTTAAGITQNYNGRKFFILAKKDLLFIHDLLACSNYAEEKSAYWYLSFFTSIHPPVFHTHSPRHGVLNWLVNVS